MDSISLSTDLFPHSGRPVLVTGASGHIGSSLVSELRSRDYLVRAAYRDRRRVADAVRSGADAVTLDHSRPETLPTALVGVDSVFLLTATSATQTRDELAVIDAAEAAGVRRIVKLSLWRADERLTPFAELHSPVEERLKRSTMQWTLLRPNFFMQNFAQLMAASIGASGLIAQPGGGAPISYIDTRDVARVAAHVLTTPGHHSRTYALTGPEALGYDQVAERFSIALRKPVRYVQLTADQARHDLLVAGVPEFIANGLVEVGVTYGAGGAEQVLPTVVELTGRRPIDLDQFISDRIDAFTQHSS